MMMMTTNQISPPVSQVSIQQLSGVVEKEVESGVGVQEGKGCLEGSADVEEVEEGGELVEWVSDHPN